jgi:hypothetical protein
MTIKISEVAGGPYAHEIDAIRDERHRAARMHIEPDFDTLFAETEISPGAFKVIEDIDKPVELPIGEFVENVVYDAKEAETAESPVKETGEATNFNFSEGTAPEETGAESGTLPTSVESPALTEEQLNDLQDAEDLLNNPIFDEVAAENNV